MLKVEHEEHQYRSYRFTLKEGQAQQPNRQVRIELDHPYTCMQMDPNIMQVCIITIQLLLSTVVLNSSKDIGNSLNVEIYMINYMVSSEV